MFRIIRLSLLVIVSSLILTALLYADNFEWDEVTSSDWSLTEDSARGIHDAVMIFEKITADDKKLEDSRCFRTIYRRIAIFSDAGRAWGDVEVPLIKTEQKVKEIQG